MNFVLDASALIAYVRAEPGADLVREILRDSKHRCAVHVLNLCEVYYDLPRTGGVRSAHSTLAAFEDAGLATHADIDSEFWQSAATLKAVHKRVSLADCFAIALAQKLEATILTADHHEFDTLAASKSAAFSSSVDRTYNKVVKQLDRRELLAAFLAAPVLGAAAPAAPVAVAKCPSYDADQVELLNGMFDQLGGLAGIVKNKTVTVKVNLTGSPGLRLQGKALGVTHYTHPKQIAALAQLLDRAGARRIRFVESAWGTAGPLEEYMLDSGWNVRQLKAISPKVTFDNTNGLGKQTKYVKFAVPGGGEIFPSYHLNQIYDETDVFVSMAKLKNHATCGVTLAMKNIFGITPASIYGDDAGKDAPNESPAQGRVNTCHFGKRQPAAIAAPERNPASSRAPEHRMPRITAELNAARPIHLSLIDGIETVTGGEGPWIDGLQHVKPGVMIVGTNALTTDTVATAIMGYDPRAPKGQGAFKKCDNTLLLAEALGVGSADLKRIEVRGVRIADAIFLFPS